MPYMLNVIVYACDVTTQMSVVQFVATLYLHAITRVRVVV